MAKKKVTKNAKKVLKQQESPNLVKMMRDDGKTADVHIAEVENYRRGGFQVVQ